MITIKGITISSISISSLTFKDDIKTIFFSYFKPSLIILERKFFNLKKFSIIYSGETWRNLDLFIL